MGQLTLSPQVCGIVFEKMLIPKIINWLGESKTLDAHPYFEGFR